MKENPKATEKAINMFLQCFDERTGAEVQQLLDRLYAKGYTQKQICEVIRKELKP